jgi:hypothetical protein
MRHFHRAGAAVVPLSWRMRGFNRAHGKHVLTLILDAARCSRFVQCSQTMGTAVSITLSIFDSSMCHQRSGTYYAHRGVETASQHHSQCDASRPQSQISHLTTSPPRERSKSLKHAVVPQYQVRPQYT